jgi:hypothetical protein
MRGETPRSPTMYAVVNDLCLWQNLSTITWVSSPRYRPKSYSLDPESYGKGPVAWRGLSPSASEDEKDQLGASLRQHAIARAIRAFAQSRHGSVRKYADVNNINYQRLTGVLRGDLILRLEDIANAERNLGLSVEDWAGQWAR